MRTKIIAILIFLFISTATLPVYYLYRLEYIEKDYINLLSDKNSGLAPLAERLNREESPGSEKLKKIFSDLTARDRSITALAVTDRMGRLRFMVKNDALLNSGRIVDELVKDIKEKKYKSADGSTPAVKNYNGSDWLSDRLYVFSFSSGEQSTIVVYSFIPGRMTKIRLALEAVLVISGLFAATAGIIMLLRRSGILKEPEYGRVRTIVIGEKTAGPGSVKKSGRDKNSMAAAEIKTEGTGEESAVQIDERELLPAEVKKAATPGEKDSPEYTATEVFNSSVFTLFKKIRRELSPESVSLYIKRTGDTLSKTYELKGKNFIRIDSAMFDVVSIPETEKKVNPVSRVIHGEQSLFIPLYDNSQIAGLLGIEFKEAGVIHELSSIMQDVKNAEKILNAYLRDESILTDRETGFSSRAHFELKLNRAIFDALNNDEEFSLLLINMFSGIPGSKERNTILSIMFPALQKAAGGKHELFLYRDYICLILKGTSVRENGNLKSVLSKEIGKFRIRLTGDDLITLNPRSVICNSSDSMDLKNILKEAETLAAGLN